MYCAILNGNEESFLVCILFECDGYLKQIEIRKVRMASEVYTHALSIRISISSAVQSISSILVMGGIVLALSVVGAVVLSSVMVPSSLMP